MYVLLLSFGNSCFHFWAVELHFLPLTIRKLTVWLSVFIAQLNKSCAATAPMRRSSGTHALLSANSRWTRRSKPRFKIYRFACCMEKRLPSLWMCLLRQYSFQLSLILYKHVLMCRNVFWTHSLSHNYVCKELQILADVMLNSMWDNVYGYLQSISLWELLLESLQHYGLDHIM